jgi:hypothetical protein
MSWRDYRLAIWMAMLGVALVLLISPPYAGALLLGMAIGIAIRVRQRQRGRGRRRRRSPPRR